jgi:prevent-host-death family protein
MISIQIGVRELKAHLGKWLQQVKAGQTIIITERGKPIGQIAPLPVSQTERMQAMVAPGLIGQMGEKLPSAEPTVVNRGPRPISDIISEERDARSLP